MHSVRRSVPVAGIHWLVAILCLSLSASLQAKDNLSPQLESLLKSQNLPGVAAVVMRDGEVVAEGVAGVRKLGEPAAITLADRFAIGSCTKRMTAFLVARLAESGKVSLDARVGEVLSDVPMRDEYKPVTLAQLLAFTGGIAGYERIGPKLTPELFDVTGTLPEREARFARHVLNLPPAGAIGREAVYSNASYLLAALMVARITGRDYQSLMDEWVFRPLKMESAGWGRPWQKDRTNQPWLHVARPDGYQPEPDIVRPPEELFRAAGNAHMSVVDLARFAQADQQAGVGKSTLIKSSERWQGIEGQRPGKAERGVHAGGTPWLAACYAVWPQHNLVAAIAVNGGTPDDATCTAFVKQVEETYIKRSKAA